MPRLDCETLLKPIREDSPAGDESHFAMTLAPELRELRREESADEFDDATRPATLKRADWTAIVRRCEESLTEQSKDLRTACALIEARTRIDGLDGLSGGLELLTRLIEECWDRTTPAPGDNAAETRAVPLANLLDDPDRGVCFPAVLRALPLIGGEDCLHSYGDWTRMRSGVSTEESEELAKARQRVSAERLTRLHSETSAALGWLDRLNQALEFNLGDDAPGLLNLRSALEDIHGLIGAELSRFGPLSGEPSRDAADMDTAPPSPQQADDCRGQLYTRLEETAQRLQQMEPHSPIPYLIKRAVRLGRLPFPCLMQQVIREPTVLTELNREFGIAETDEAEALA